jgi:hypothetical protein
MGARRKKRGAGARVLAARAVVGLGLVSVEAELSSGATEDLPLRLAVELAAAAEGDGRGEEARLVRAALAAGANLARRAPGAVLSAAGRAGVDGATGKLAFVELAPPARRGLGPQRMTPAAARQLLCGSQVMFASGGRCVIEFLDGGRRAKWTLTEGEARDLLAGAKELGDGLRAAGALPRGW